MTTQHLHRHQKHHDKSQIAHWGDVEPCHNEPKIVESEGEQEGRKNAPDDDESREEQGEHEVLQTADYEELIHDKLQGWERHG